MWSVHATKPRVAVMTLNPYEALHLLIALF
jgi:hypothetical protein